MAQLIENLAGDWRRLDERIEGLSGEIEALLAIHKTADEGPTVHRLGHSIRLQCR